MLTTQKAATAVDIQIRFVDPDSDGTSRRDFEGLCARTAAVTAAAYRAGDLVPGLPVADGARERAEDVRADLDAGRRLWVAAVDGEVAGSVRAVPRPDGDWEVRRLAVAPWVRRAGLGRLLLRRLEADAVAHGVRRVVLDAVVERGNPAFYARVGFRTVRHFAAADKPLSEVHMERDPRATAAAGRPYDPGTTGWAVSWWAAPGGVRCLVGAPMPAAPADRLLGIDCLPAASADQQDALVRGFTAAADRVEPDGALFFAGPAPLTAAFAQPRLIHPSLLAWWRSPAARTRP
ncbi:GNAT family N-acetyltransferase [Streptomyces sp. NPDC091268]|uniref:GNAT family N-acetyltransferase n=1 Tax=Streptomyces sp. NPDC091268 TaxID=3365979 RepID=UPI0037FFAEA3